MSFLILCKLKNLFSKIGDRTQQVAKPSLDLRFAIPTGRPDIHGPRRGFNGRGRQWSCQYASTTCDKVDR